MSERRGKLSTAALLLGSLAVRWPVPVLGFVLLITGVLGSFALGVDQDDDVIRFLPQGDVEVERFQAIGRRFGGLSIAVVGLEVVDEDKGADLFTLERLELVREIDEALRGLDGVNATTAFTELPDIVETQTDAGRSRADLHDLVGNLPPPDSPDLEAFLDDARQRTTSRAHVMGSLVSSDASATIILCQIDPDAPMKATADAIRAEVTRLVEAHDAGVQPHFAGAPFVGSYAAENTRRDLLALSPWVVAAVVLIMLVTSRSLSAVLIALFSVGAGIAQVMGGLGVLGRDLTLISSSLPVLLVALGSAYSVHLLAATLASLDRRGDGDRRAAVVDALTEAGPPILIAGLTTAAGFVSFVVMDVAPMREFGILMALATVLIVVVTLLVVPAASVLLPMKPRQEGRAPRWALGAMRAAASAVARHRAAAIAVLVAVGAIAGYGASQVRAHTDIRTLFSEDSEPVRAERFLESRFGGSLFLQVELAGDIKSPAVLRQVDRIATVAAGLDDISRVESVTTAVNIASWATTGEPRVPPRRETTAALGTMVISNPAARLLVEDDWRHTLLQIQLDAFDITRARQLAGSLAERLEPLIGARVAVRRAGMSAPAREAERAEIVAHLAAVLRAHGVAEAHVDEARLEAALGADALGGLRKEVADELRYNLVDDPMVTLADPTTLDAVIDQVMEQLSGGTLDAEAFFEILVPVVAPSEKENLDSLREGTDFVFAAVRDIGAERVRAARVESVLAQVPAREASPLDTLDEDVERALWTLGDPVAFVPASAVADTDEVLSEESGELAMTVSGYPLVYAAMNDSVERNQWGSLLTSAILVLLALAWFYRSLTTAAIALVPAAFTLLVTFGLMGFLKIPMDVGTSMIAAIALGVGIDYAVHLLWRHGRPAAEQADARLSEALSATGWGIVINALEVSVGLSLLVLGTIVPMRNFGLLTATAMLVSAACTLLVVPALARRSVSAR